MIRFMVIGFILINKIIDTYALRELNRPRFCPNATWDIDATTFANRSVIGTYPYGIFVNSKNSIYVSGRQRGQILIWENANNIRPPRVIYGSLSIPSCLFVTTNDDIYVCNGPIYHRIDKWSANTNTWMTVMSLNMSASCYGIFIDIYRSLYCSMTDISLVVKKSLNDTANTAAATTTIITAAGTGMKGSTSDRLSGPRGLFVDINLDLYVADHGNDRVQLFHFGQQNGITIVGRRSSPPSIDLNGPHGIVLDGDQYLFIVDQMNSRIIRSDEYGFRCIFGCTPGILHHPRSISLDSYGNIYITERTNHRIQKIHLSKKACILTSSYNQPRFCLNTTWNPNGITFANQSTIGGTPRAIFINSNNSIYIPNRATGEIHIWTNASSTHPSKTILARTKIAGLNSIFVTTNGLLSCL